MPRSRARKQAAQRVYLRRRYLRGLCARCLQARQPDSTLCVACGPRESTRRNDYQRRVLGARPRYADGRGYGPRVRLAPPRVAVAMTDCPRCQGCLVAEGHDRRCLNCGHVVMVRWRAERRA